MIAFPATLRSKFLLALALISALLTWTTLMLVRHRVEIRVREEIERGLRNSVATFRILSEQRETTLERSAALLASLPPLKAVMTSQDTATIQDASTEFWKMGGSQLFVLSDRYGNPMAVHTSTSGFTSNDAREAMSRALKKGETRDWWFGNGHLFQVFFQPISFGPAAEGTQIGVLAVGYEIDDGVASDVGHVASSQVAFQYGKDIVVSTVPAAEAQDLRRNLAGSTLTYDRTREMQLGHERFLATSVRLSPANSSPVTLTVLKSYDEAAAFLESLNRWIIGIGIAAVLAGSVLVFLVSTSFTRPLAKLAGGVRALEEGDFSWPLEPRGNDEVSALTAAFLRMRGRLQDTQRQLLDSERLATIGRMASTISHDLRRPLTAILAYAEFLAERNLSEESRKDFFEEIRIAVNRMTDELNSLLGFSRQREAIRPVFGRMEEVIDRAIHTVKVLPEFQAIRISFTFTGDCSGWFDPGKVERVMLNLLFNACEAVDPSSGKIAISCGMTESGLEITLADNGPGIPESIRSDLFQPFVSSGKEKGIGLGLTAVQKIMQNHGGEVRVQSTGSTGTVFRLFFPVTTPPDQSRISDAAALAQSGVPSAAGDR